MTDKFKLDNKSEFSDWSSLGNMSNSDKSNTN